MISYAISAFRKQLREKVEPVKTLKNIDLQVKTAHQEKATTKKQPRLALQEVHSEEQLLQCLR